MRHIVLAALLCAAPMALAPVTAHVAAVAMGAPVPKDQLMKPPADAVHYVVVSEAGKHGDQWSWELPGGKTAYRWSQELRGWITELDQVMTLSQDGSIQALTVRGVTMTGIKG